MQETAQTLTRAAAELSLIGSRLRSLRKANNLSQREVAEAIGLPQSNLSRIENGKQRLNLSVLARMLTMYDLTIPEFFAQQPLEGSGGADDTTELSAAERRLLDAYRSLPTRHQSEVEGYVDYKLFQAKREAPSA